MPTNNTTQDTQKSGWEESCLKLCKQTKEDSDHGQAPDCVMICLRKKGVEETKNESNEPIDENVYAVNLSRFTNMLKGYSVRVARGREECTETKEQTSSHTSKSNKRGSTIYELDLDEKLSTASKTAERLVKETVDPAYKMSVETLQALKDNGPPAVATISAQILESLKDGSPSSLLEKLPKNFDDIGKSIKDQFGFPFDTNNDKDNDKKSK
ncbi:hypothetical protein J3Q64DRAFT_1425515 [Phycomyces blakesleeanus]|uniref:Uncharacterized protein n=2 Tax=Phycomyces blakesleeanus TaxID=4837 RepID=A0A162TQY0_PHYB8|nr:hypothetical protein PHYBLDRAFT_60262 [Phycomyces blakesleeanus NRRL 1555(-)]OAD70362.1 hypothetical protein PHYBLDRAFT_60262 [Phycomyces blakesleeanus NRRL 1555(-)]|eukprot:XP_018288402.1 hypothetical protein PHYBLDRAFT_60262 [Phycomyces blakesleeanus NRRL 1555(-)]